MGSQLFSKYCSEFLIGVVRLEFGKGLLGSTEPVETRRFVQRDQLPASCS